MFTLLDVDDSHVEYTQIDHTIIKTKSYPLLNLDVN